MAKQQYLEEMPKERADPRIKKICYNNLIIKQKGYIINLA
jgi:hypothetical protein